jgi:hypothetical protein
MIAHKKNVSAINREFAITTDQSCLNRWVTGGNCDEETLNRERLAWLQESPDTRYSPQGVIAIDNTLIDHDGKHIEDAGYFWDHAEQRHKIAHDYFTNAANLNHIHHHQRAYVGDLKFNRKIQFMGRDIRADEMAAQIAPEDRKEICIGDSKQWYFTKSIRIPDVNHKVRIVILWAKKNDKQAKKMVVCNRTHWDIIRVLKVYSCRWTGTECFHRDGKQHLGMGECQLRNGRGQTRHMYLVFLAYSVLMRQLRQGRAREWARERLTTIGQACMTVLRQTLSDTIEWVIERIEGDNWDFGRIKFQLALP